MRSFLSRLICFLAAASVLHASARARDFTSEFFDLLVTLGGIDPDHIELVLYSIDEPGHAASVFSHAAAQDYPFFALVAAVKAAKGKDFPEIGTFTEAKCVAPLTVFDKIFGAADSYIDGAAAKENTSTVVSSGSQIAADFAKAQTAEAKQALLDQLAETIPYFGELPTICNFGFETEFTIERNIHALVGNVTVGLRNAYVALSAGEMIEGVAALLDIGMTSDAACAIADGIMQTGALGNMPIIGELATGLCKGFLGEIIGVFASVSDYAEALGSTIVDGGTYVVCGVYSFFGGSCSSAPPPPTAVSAASQYCAARGGIDTLLSSSNQPNDYSVACVDGSSCRVVPGAPPRCISSQEKLINQLKARAKNRLDFALLPKQWAKRFEAEWIEQCQDDTCRFAIRVVSVNAQYTLANAHAKDPDLPYGVMGVVFGNADADAQSAIDASQLRSAQKNLGITASAAEAWEQITTSFHGKKCEDKRCVDAVVALSAELKATLIATQEANPDKSALGVQNIVGPMFGKKFEAEVKNSRLRSDPAESVGARLPAFGCARFLGRARQWACFDNADGFAACKDYIRQGDAEFCISGSGEKFTLKDVVANRPNTFTVGASWRDINPIPVGKMTRITLPPKGVAEPKPERAGTEPNGRPARRSE